MVTPDNANLKWFFVLAACGPWVANPCFRQPNLVTTTLHAVWTMCTVSLRWKRVQFTISVQVHILIGTARLCSNFWIGHNLGSTVQVAFSYVRLKKPATNSKLVQDNVETCEPWHWWHVANKLPPFLLWHIQSHGELFKRPLMRYLCVPRFYIKCYVFSTRDCLPLSFSPSHTQWPQSTGVCQK